MEETSLQRLEHHGDPAFRRRFSSCIGFDLVGRCALVGGLFFVKGSIVFAATSVSLGVAYILSDSEEETAYRGTMKLVELGHEKNYLFPEQPGWLTSIRTSYLADPSSTAVSGSLDQGLGNGISLGVTRSQTRGVSNGDDEKGFSSSSTGGRFSFWLRKNTLRIGLEGSGQDTSRSPRDYTDTDGRRVLVAENAKGVTSTVRVTHLTTPTLILMANASQTRSSGRPAAVSYGGEVRKYIVPIKASLHVALDQYRDQKEVELDTDYGKIDATSETLRFQQRIIGDFIWGSTTRWQQENEMPRSVDSETLKRRHVSQMLSLRWRYVEGSWTDDASEVGLYTGYFTSRETKDDIITTEFIRMIGLQLKAVF